MVIWSFLRGEMFLSLGYGLGSVSSGVAMRLVGSLEWGVGVGKWSRDDGRFYGFW